MWRRVGVGSAVAWGVLLTIGCRAPQTFNCQDDAGCGDTGQCEANGFCSFPDGECESGRRYGDLAGAGLQGQCVAPAEGSTGTPVGGTTGDDPPETTGCTPGTNLCACAQGRCEAGLDCIANLCVPSVDATFSTSSGSDETGASASTEGSSTTGDSGGDDSTAAEPTTTGNPGGCNMTDVACDACFSCVDETECAMQTATCEGIIDCMTIASCIDDCAVGGVCFMDCCAGASETAHEAAEALHACRRDACSGRACERYAVIPERWCGA